MKWFVSLISNEVLISLRLDVWREGSLKDKFHLGPCIKGRDYNYFRVQTVITHKY